ncbi:unnamed protein product [marine sediment metagenome]|uniref:Uncharacterized protein n=1 Tax=marine sediment metagenome TaxID=412755 RepID=X0YQ08_9ZZZZ
MVGGLGALANSDGLAGALPAGGASLEDDLKGLLVQNAQSFIDQPLPLRQPVRPAIVNTTNAQRNEGIRMV